MPRSLAPRVGDCDGGSTPFSAMRELAMDATDLRIPDIPLATCDDDIDSTKHSSQGDEPNDNVLEDDSRMNDDFSGSLEDLVGNFDERIAKCLKNPEVATQDFAPVQVRTQDEVMNESQTWWTLTGNFGNIQPLDFDKSAICKKMLPSLDLREKVTAGGYEVVGSHCQTLGAGSDDGGLGSLSDEDELRHQMDVHQLISQGGSMGGDTPPQTADQVIEEIDEMLQSCDFTGSMMTDRTMESVDSMYSSMRSPSAQCSDADVKLRHAQALVANPDNLQELSYSKLVTLSAEMEQLIQVYNESLVEELAHRDELEYEKEMKKTRSSPSFCPSKTSGGSLPTKGNGKG
ncbi:unnamed protein product [Caenorhabditis auriculariae]|uniref:FEZ-like protein n=1 Tax=Caenorhabditis auriculariae TaxID=2777116 RepID=A0A8S1H8S6_9PELO|nr:unnamed protein product [Caenorhabditis auriculariae]